MTEPTILVSTVGKLSLLQTLTSIRTHLPTCPIVVATFANCDGVEAIANEYDAEFIQSAEGYRGTYFPTWLLAASVARSTHHLLTSDDVLLTPNAPTLLEVANLADPGSREVAYSYPTFVGHEADGSLAQYLCSVYGLIVPASRMAGDRLSSFATPDHFELGLGLAKLGETRVNPSADFLQTFSPAVLCKADLRPQVDNA